MKNIEHLRTQPQLTHMTPDSRRGQPRDPGVPSSHQGWQPDTKRPCVWDAEEGSLSWVGGCI